jgi:hypothetical protein
MTQSHLFLLKMFLLLCGPFFYNNPAVSFELNQILKNKSQEYRQLLIYASISHATFQAVCTSAVLLCNDNRGQSPKLQWQTSLHFVQFFL